MEALAVLICLLVVVGVFVLPVISLCQIGGIRGDLQRLRDELARLHGKVKVESPVAESAPAPEPAIVPAPAPAPEPAPVPEPVSEPVPTPESAVVRPPVVVSECAEHEETAFEILLARIGNWFAVRGEFAPQGMTREFAFVTRWLIRLGVALLVGCVIYFMKLSVDRGWVGPAARTVSVVAWGAAFAVLGAWMVRRTRYAPVGHALAGLGFIGMYLGFGLGHKFFNPPVIASAIVAFASLATVTVLAGIYAVRLPSAMVAVLGLVGGYLVPVIAGQDSGNPTGLYVYLLAINLAAAYVAHLRRWSALNFLAATLGFALCVIWQCGHASAPKGIYFLSFGFLSAVHALYLAATVAGSHSRGKAGNAIAWTGLALNATGYLTWLLVVFRPIVHDHAAGFIFLATVAVYAVLAHFSIRRGWADRLTVEMMLVFAFAYLAFAPLMIVAKPYLVTAWCLIAAATGEAGRRSRQSVLGYLALLLVGLASFLSVAVWMEGAYSMRTITADGSYLADLLVRVIRFACVPATLAAAACRGWIRGANNEVRATLWAFAAALAFVFLTAEARLFGGVYLPGLKGGTVTLVWGLVAIGSLIGGVVGRRKSVRTVSLILLAVAVAKLLFFDTARIETSYRVLTFGLTGVALICGALVYLKFKERFEDNEAA